MFAETRSPRAVATIVASPSRIPMILGGAAFLVAAGVGAFVLLRPQPAPPLARAPGSDLAVAALSEALASTQVELARRDLEDKNYKSAISNAERALKIAPANADARRVMEQAKAQVDAIEAEANEARASLEKGDTEKATQALSRLLVLDPRHPAAVELSARLNSSFQTEAEDAKKSMADSRSLAEKTKASSSEAFSQAGGLARDAEALLAKGEFASATRGFLDARDGFDRARRAAEAKPLPSPSPKPAAAAGMAGASGPPAALSAANAPAATLPSVSAPPASEPPKALAPPRAFVAGATFVEAAKRPGKAPAGFDSDDVLADRDFLCKLAFENSPAAVQPGDDYSIRVFMENDTGKTIRMKSIGLVVTENGQKAARPALSPKESAPRSRTLLGQLGGSWPEGVNSWQLDAVVASSKDDVCRSRLALK
jgi:hypothetical protein